MTTPSNALQRSIETIVGRGHDPKKLSKALCEIDEIESWADNEGRVWFAVTNPVDVYRFEIN